MRVPFAVAHSVLLAATVAVLAPATVAAQQPQTAAPSRADSLTAQLVELELQRVTPPATAMLFPDTRAPDVAPQIAALHAELRALPAGIAADREAVSRVMLALDARASAVHARLQELRLRYTDVHPAVRRTQDEARAVDQRLADLRASR